MKTPVFLLIYFLVPFFSACTIHDDGSMRSNSGEIIRFSEKEVLENRKQLLNPDPKEIEKMEMDSSDTTSLFDGNVISIEIQDNGLRIVNIEINRVIAGIIKNRKKIQVLTPDPEKGGMNFEVGKNYRVLTMFLDDKYRTWDWLVAPLPP